MAAVAGLSAYEWICGFPMRPPKLLKLYQVAQGVNSHSSPATHFQKGLSLDLLCLGWLSCYKINVFQMAVLQTEAGLPPGPVCLFAAFI